MSSFTDAPEAAAILNGAERVRTVFSVNRSPYGQAGFSTPHQEVKDLYSGPSGTFLVHFAFFPGWIRQRVLPLPEGTDLSPEACLAYESEHSNEYSRWYDLAEHKDPG